MRKMAGIAKLDLRDFLTADRKSRRDFAAALRLGLEESGFIRITGHEIDCELIDAVYAHYEAFFALPGEAKECYSGVAGGQRGFIPSGVEHARDHVAPDLKEFFHVGQPREANPPDRVGHPCNVWPSEIPDLRDASLALFRGLERCAGQLLEALAIAYGLDERVFADMLVAGNSILRAVHYPPVSRDADPRALRAAPHEDINLITLLCGATDSGLEILTPAGEWLAVETLQGEIVADAGDMLSRVTNGVIPSTTHRVTVSEWTRAGHRYALPFFAHPYPSCDLSVLAKFISKNEAARFPPILAADFLEQRLKEIGLLD